MDGCLHRFCLVSNKSHMIRMMEWEVNLVVTPAAEGKARQAVSYEAQGISEMECFPRCILLPTTTKRKYAIVGPI